MNNHLLRAADLMLDIVDEAVAAALEGKARVFNHAHDMCIAGEEGMKQGLKMAIEELLDAAAVRRNDIDRRAKGRGAE